MTNDTTTDPHREALRQMGLDDGQIDAALAHLEAAAAPTDRRPDYARIQEDVARQRAAQHIRGCGLPPTHEGRCLEVETGITRPCDMTAGDLFLSLNGFDEIAIALRFGAPVTALREDAVTLGRALAFVNERRLGANDADAYKAAMSLTIDTITHGYFTPEPDQPEPASAEGNAPEGGA